MCAACPRRTIAARRTQVRGSLAVDNQEFPFVLSRQPLPLGTAGTVDFFYMLPGELRGGDPERELSNFRSCVAYWWACTQQAGLGRDPHQVRHFVMATTYALVRKDKGQQRVYRDAYLRQGSLDLEELSVTGDTQAQIRRVVDQRDRNGVKALLDDALEARRYSSEDLRGHEKAFGVWVDKGVNAFMHGHVDGLERWLKEIDYWLHKYRKRSPARVRDFIDFFSYQAKASFYLCFANFWSNLIPWLEEHHKLDDLSKRFLSVWHNQNQPIEVPREKTRKNILYTIPVVLESRQPEDPKGLALLQAVHETPRIGPAVIPDVFSAQVLSLHPLSWCLLSSPELREVAGRLFASPHFDEAMRLGSTADFPEYWEFVNAVLTAAYLYRASREAFEGQRRVQEIGGAAVDALQRDDAPPPVAEFLTGYIRSRRITCEQCDGVYAFREGELPAPQSDDVRELPVRCKRCGHTATVTVTEDQLHRYLLAEQ